MLLAQVASMSGGNINVNIDGATSGGYMNNSRGKNNNNVNNNNNNGSQGQT